MTSRSAWARAAALTGAFVIVTAGLPMSAFAQEAPSVALEQARSGEDGSSGAGAGSGSMSTGTAKRDKSGNGGNASAGSAGDTSTGGATGGGGQDLPPNAATLEALGVLDDVTTYGLDILTGLNIPVELLPPPVESPATAPADINTGGQGSSNISTAPGSGAAPAGGSTSSSADDGTGSSSNGEKKKDRSKKSAEDSADGGAETSTSSGDGTATGS